MTRVDWGAFPVRFDPDEQLHWVHRHGINWYLSPCCLAICSADERGIYCKACYGIAPMICGSGPHDIAPTPEQVAADQAAEARLR